jgi:hypothetical protein
MFFNDHPPPHFDARYGEFEATVDLGTLEVVQGELPRRALNLVRNGRRYTERNCWKIGGFAGRIDPLRRLKPLA